ncbi:right-handed parallel beta-helix repeat-containing protein [Coraliomargarita algicola]|uniref:Right-handed parallel beta-helix repeat-containing protein n=1 Tax=Coraliomargarita algicola TaxID=3092156 RepID=A0ABZ0RKD3_9BACT|nr:right-handed parallel beta-helix repeat-containing protein [Coraliomargarita sp. J2-16]WPJ95377.1 right-handed parallel beta-helix repeat-containing protein [Coraliomargarita sp. J2-16]
MCCLSTANMSSAAVAEIDDLQSWIMSQVQDGQTKIKVPQATYRLAPVHSAHLELIELKGIEIDFQGSEIVCTDRTRAIHLEKCENVVIKNLSIDYDPMLYTQGLITEFTPEYFQIEVFEGYPMEGLSAKGAEVYSAETHELKPGFRTFHDIKSITKMEGRSLRVYRKKHLRIDSEFVEVGDVLLLKTERKRIDGGSFAPHCVYSTQCRDLLFENVTVYASNCFSFLGEESSNIHYYRCRVDRKKNDPKVSYPRMRSSNWDAFHSINAEVGPTIEECYAGYMGDDGVNIRGDYHVVAEGEGAVLTVISKRALNIQLGDPVEVVSRNGKLLGEAVATHIARARDYPKEKIESAKDQFTLILPGNLRDAWYVTLDRVIPIDDVSVICAVNRVGRGFKVINNVIGHNRSRGILTKASDGVISGNLVEDTGLESLKLSPNISNWLEAAYYSNLVVKDNVIRNGKFATHFGSHQRAQILIGGCRSGLEFTGNTIEYTGERAMVLSDLEGGVMRGNTFTRLDGGEAADPVLFENVTGLGR